MVRTIIFSGGVRGILRQNMSPSEMERRNQSEFCQATKWLQKWNVSEDAQGPTSLNI